MSAGRKPQDNGTKNAQWKRARKPAKIAAPNHTPSIAAIDPRSPPGVHPGWRKQRRPEIQPRLLNNDQAAQYCGMSVNHFLNHVSPSLHRVRFNGSTLKRWDVREIDRLLDALVEGQQVQRDSKAELADTLEKFGDDLAREGRKARPS